MPTLNEVTAALETIAPLDLAADWDATGLLVGGRHQRCDRVMTCLTLSPEVAAEAARESADLVVTHHPLLFRPVARVTDDSAVGSALLTLVAADVSVWSSHTAWDSAIGGINDQLAAILSISQVRPIVPHASRLSAGVGRMGIAADGETVGGIARLLARALALPGAHVAGDSSRRAGSVGIICGSGGDLLAEARTAGCDTLVTGEVRLHTAVEAKATGMAIVAIGHHASEHFAMETLARRLAEMVAGLEVWASREELEPLTWIERASIDGTVALDDSRPTIGP